MAKIEKYKAFIGYFKGALNAHDRTKLDRGALSVRNAKNSLRVLKQPTKKGSAARHARSEAYCMCDTKYNEMGDPCREKLREYQLRFGTLDQRRLNRFQFYMQLCLDNFECNFWKWANCFTVSASFIREGDYVIVSGSTLPRIQDIPVELILNNTLLYESATELQGEIKFSIHVDELLPGMNEFWFDVCGIASNKMVYSPTCDADGFGTARTCVSHGTLGAGYAWAVTTCPCTVAGYYTWTWVKNIPYGCQTWGFPFANVRVGDLIGINLIWAGYNRWEILLLRPDPSAGLMRLVQKYTFGEFNGKPLTYNNTFTSLQHDSPVSGDTPLGEWHTVNIAPILRQTKTPVPD